MNPTTHKAFSAVVSGDIQKLNQCLASMDINEGSGKHTLLHAAAESGNMTIVANLIAGRADVNALDKNGMTPLQVAIERKNFGLYQYLKKSGTDLEIADSSGARALHWAVQVGAVDIVQDLLSTPVDVAPKAKFDSTPLHLAARTGSVQIMKLLIQFGSPLDETTKGHTALHISAMKGFVPLVQTLVSAGASLECKNTRDWTPLHIAASSSKFDTFKALVECRASLDAIDTEGYTPYDIAKAKGVTEIVDYVHSITGGGSSEDEFSNVALALFPYNQDILGPKFDSNRDLSFTAGSVITDIKPASNSGWLIGSIVSESGMFPESFVSSNILGKAKCIYTYYATQLDELNIKKGEDMYIYERRESGWLRVISSGKGGLVPRTHIRELRSMNNTLAVSPRDGNRIGTPIPPKFTGSKKSPRASTSSLPRYSVNKQKSPRELAPAQPTNLGPPSPRTNGPPPNTVGPPPMVNNNVVKKSPKLGAKSRTSVPAYGFKLPPVQGLPKQTKTAKISPTSVIQPQLVKPPAPVPQKPKVRVLYPYQAQHPGDLELTVGAIVELTKSDDSGWWEGTYNGKTGIFPANYVEKI